MNRSANYCLSVILLCFDLQFGRFALTQLLTCQTAKTHTKSFEQSAGHKVKICYVISDVVLSLQCLRGLHNLRSGGRLVYSTCSLNPLENEAVVAEALRQFDGSVKLVNQSHAFTELVRRPGLVHWKV